MIKAFDSQKYDNIETKYAENFFDIDYNSKLKELLFNKKHFINTTKMDSIRLKEKISRLSPNQFKNEVAMFGNFKAMIEMKGNSKLMF